MESQYLYLTFIQEKRSRLDNEYLIIWKKDSLQLDEYVSEYVGKLCTSSGFLYEY